VKRWERNRSALNLDIAADARIAPSLVVHLRTNLAAAHAMLKPPLRALSVALIGDARMSQLHEQFLGIKGPTDVLTFELEHDRRNRVTAGEVVICVPEARRQAKERGIELRMELLLYALHGMLHLCGFDDRTDRGFRTMHRREDDILTALGFGPVFAAPLASSSPVKRRRRRPSRSAARSRDGAA
jgi:probable rRNA maturation factor